MWYHSDGDKTPLLCAAKAGHIEIVAYLLQFKSVLTYLKEQPEEIPDASVSETACLMPGSYSENVSCSCIFVGALNNEN